MRRSLFVLLIVAMASVSFGIKVNILHEWKYCEYEWKNWKQMENAIVSGTYNKSRCLMLDVERIKDYRIFVTMPNDIPNSSPPTLATVTNKRGPRGPLLRPYPNWNWYNKDRLCEGIVNVPRVNTICDHLFVMDNGKNGDDQLCNPKLLIFDLKYNTLVKTIYIPIDIATNKTMGYGSLQTIVVYNPGSCKRLLDEMIVVISDIIGYGLVVYDASKKRMCRVESDYMKPTDPILSIGLETIIYERGVYSLAISGDCLIYAPVAGTKAYKIKMKTLLECPSKEKANKESHLKMKLISQTGSIASMAGKCALIYSGTRQMNIVGHFYDKKVILAQDSRNFQGVSSLKAYDNHTLIGLSDRIQKFATDRVNLNEINFRYFVMDLEREISNMCHS